MEPTYELFSYSPHVGPFRIFIIVVCVLIIIAIVVTGSVFTFMDKRTFKEPEGGYAAELYGGQSKV